MSFHETDDPNHNGPSNTNPSDPSNTSSTSPHSPTNPDFSITPTPDTPTGPSNHPDNASAAPTSEETFEKVYGYKPSDSPEEAAREMLKEALVPAVNTIVQLSQFSANERIRSDNAKLIVEMNLGKVGNKTQPLGDMWDELLKELTGGTGDGNGHKAAD